MSRDLKLPIRKKLPQSLERLNFIVELVIPNEEEEEGLVEIKDIDDIPVTVVMCSKDCTIAKIGVEPIISPYSTPRVAFRIDRTAYFMYSENDILGIW